MLHGNITTFALWHWHLYSHGCKYFGCFGESSVYSNFHLHNEIMNISQLVISSARQWLVLFSSMIRQRHITLIMTQAACCCCSGAFVSQSQWVYTYRCGPNLRPQTLTCNQTAIQPALSFDGLQALLLIYWPQRDGRLSWPGWLTHSGQFTVHPHSYHLSTIDQGKSASRRPTS